MKSLLSGRSDLPLDRDAHSRFLPWLIAFMVFLAVLALTGMLILKDVALKWDSGVSGTLSVQIPPTADPVNDEQRLSVILTILASEPTIGRYEVITDERMKGLLKPWLGNIDDMTELPLPQLIDVELKPGQHLDIRGLGKRLVQVVPGVSIDDHQVWLQRLVNLIRTVQGVATLILLFIAFATIGTVIFTTRTGLAIHREAIEVLHLIGAQDNYIAGQFSRRALMLGLKGGIIGLLLGVPTILGVGYLARRMDGLLLPAVQLQPEHWIGVGILPVLVAGIAMITARTTVLRTLSRML
jgi:cell division transport system permease protein